MQEMLSKLIEREFIATVLCLICGVYLYRNGDKELGAGLIASATAAFTISRGIAKRGTNGA